MFEVFKYVSKFFTSLTNYLTYNDIFIIFVGLFLFTAIVVFVSTANSYEAKLIKAIDKFNTYFIDNPHINEENLVSFNAKMKSRKVPKPLRKSWQQFVLYREHKASEYMSFENCVSNPIKNSSYKRDTRLMSVLSYIFSACALILNCFYCYETSDLASVLSSVLLTPVIILLLNFIMQIFFNIKHSAIVSDLFQNYQYFEVNIDKATETLPDYVDYEVLFDRNEIKKGIPILYAYLQKRAEEEQRELERARLKNVEHEKFNFDDTGVEASLVLERAMQEAENYIAERKKYIQDTEQINADITQEDMNYREITKEYNRQMQVSKETFANFKAQLEDVSSTIEANYLKKQQQQELDRQRNLERDFDTATERHKKIIESFQSELDTVDKFIAESRNNLEKAMKSEFSSYSSKVYDAAKKVVEEREKEKVNKLKQHINDLEEELVLKNKELEKAYSDNQLITEKLDLQQSVPQEQKVFEEPNQEYVQEEPVEYQPLTYSPSNYYETEEPQDNYEENSTDYQQYNYNSENYYDTEESTQENYEQNQNEYQPLTYNQTNYYKEEDEEDDDSDEDLIINPEYLQDDQEFDDVDDQEFEEEVQGTEISTEQFDDGIKKVAPKRGRPRKVVDAIQGEKRTRGRPKKQVDATTQPKRKVGRPKKVVEDKVEEQPKKGRGRPKKVQTQMPEINKPSQGRGRPKKVVEDKIEEQPKKGRGRPKKVQTQMPEINKPSQGRGRPKKIVEQKIEEQPKRGRGRPKKGVQPQQSIKVQNSFAMKNKEQKKLEDLPDSIVDIDEYIKQIDSAIAEENAKLEETQKELAKNAKLRRKK